MPLMTDKSTGESKQPTVAKVPFIRASHRVSEPAFDVTATVTGSTQQLGPFDVPAPVTAPKLAGFAHKNARPSCGPGVMARLAVSGCRNPG